MWQSLPCKGCVKLEPRTYRDHTMFLLAEKAVADSCQLLRIVDATRFEGLAQALTGIGISSLTDFKKADRTHIHAVCTDHSIPADTVAPGMQLLSFAVQGGTVGDLFDLLGA